MLAFLRRTVVGAGALCAALLAALLAVEKSGLLVRFLERRLAAELGPLAERVTIERAALSWFVPGLELSGLALSPAGQAAPDLYLERVALTFSPRLDEVREVRIEGGRLLLGPRLFDDWSQLSAARAERAAAGAVHPPAHGSLAGLGVALELHDGSAFDLGTLELAARASDATGYELAGRLRPSLGGALAAHDPILVNGELTAEHVRLWASARDLALESRALPPGALERPLPVAECSALLTLDSAFELAFGDRSRPRGTLRASLAGGRLLLAPDKPWIEDLALEFQAELDPTSGSDLWQREAWDGRARLHARAEATPLWAWVELGRNVPDGHWIEAWGRARNVPVDRAAFEALGLESRFALVRSTLDPRGSVDLDGTLRAGLTAERRWTRDLALHVRSAGELGLTYLGAPGDPESGIPLPLTGVSGELLFAEQSTLARPWRLIALDLAGEHGSGTAAGWAQLTAGEPGGAFAQPELDLQLSTPTLAVDPALERALAANRYLSWIGPAFAPANGTLAGDWRMRAGPELDGISAAGEFRFHGLSLRWDEVPVPMDGVDGKLSVRWAERPAVLRDSPREHHRPFGVEYQFDNRREPRVGSQARVAGWVREDSLPSVVERAAIPAELLQELTIDIDELRLRGGDFDVLAARFPALEKEVQDYGAVGRMRVRYHGAQPRLATPFVSEIEATPLEVHVRPQFFQRLTRDLRGRILIQAEEGSDGEKSQSQLVLAGAWPGGVELLARGTIPVSGEAIVHVLGAGIDPTNTSFKGALITTLASSSPATGGIDLSSWTLAGPVDLALETTFDPATTDPARNRYRIHLRDNDFVADELVLRDLHGTFEQEDEVLASPLVLATLGGHPLELRDVRSFPLAVLARVSAADPLLAREGFWKDASGRALQADVHTRDMPLDADHLAGLLEPEALEILRGNSHWRGLIDVLGARLVVTSEADDQGKVALRGELRPHDLAMSLGLPIRIETARVKLNELVNESGLLRGWAHIEGLSARIAERELDDARMIAGYVDGRLTVDNLSGAFEGGRLESLGGAGGGASKALGIDLSEPYRFDVAVRLTDVAVGGLLRGVFQSSIADEGILDAALQISGTPGEILDLAGRGSLSLDEGALWSIPVMRELFLQLGFDRTGLFDRLRARFELRGGRVQISHLEIRSDLLDLVGEGWQDLDGMLSYDLEVRYGLLDRLGPVGRVLYWLNNNLMRVAVRGDFERPEVTIRNSILELLRDFDEHPPRRLPLPHFSALGPRF